MEDSRGVAWRVVPIACALLAVPTVLAPDSPTASVTYLAALVLVVGAVWRGALQLHGGARQPWVLLALAATAWLAGDTVQRVYDAVGLSTDWVGLPDLFWLASYPLMIAAVVGMVRSRGMSRTQRVEMRLDVLVVAVAAAVSSWQLLVRPAYSTDTVSLTTLVGALYPLADVAVFALALTLLLAPGRRGVPTALLMACFVLTFPIDCAQALLPLFAPGLDGAHLDGALTVVNGLLGAAALHPRRAELTTAPTARGSAPLDRWRVLLLGVSLAAVSLTSALASGWQAVVPSLVATLVVTAAVVLRFYRVVRERERAEAALQYQAHHDQLTGAANRTLLMRRLTDDLATGATASLALVFIDLDGFKPVNDVHGHQAGDVVLQAVTSRLQALVRQADTVARVGGDEFVLLCPGTDEDGAQTLARRIAEAVGRPVPLVGDHGATRVQVQASVGVLAVTAERVAGLRAGAADAERVTARVADDLLRSVDAAMYAAKRDGGGVRTAELAGV
ncbi:GGDEF domain-containing protein [Modestobacter versicolor]|uniref:Diguanylate cyclase (GGDEF)-like protein n=1 Tax=Modestobacter versicolor TaxID=429133 RepID=A0A323VF79_9ACTN|nr:GGDEF domain-containing protein [Modestobacter versicolor]MBB3674660.1 diguanylate cyclase (GGDEF)-like protein [Modestobacter versicolor]PZA23269.1 GGDEF domain-containing protein [Modestobacter versicolor]